MGAIVVSGQTIRVLDAPLGQQLQPQWEKKAVPALAWKFRKILRAAADEIIPESDGMPSASAAGTLDYLYGVFAKNPVITREFQSGLPALEAISEKRFKEGFLRLSRADRVKALSEPQRAEPRFFDLLRDCVYEGYYLLPQVWKLIGYEFYPSQKPVPRMKPFDEKVLEKVRNRPKLYREVR